ncbi:MAG: hypothetical protein NT062_25140 [Proteobacteria bacterium]|nr:hypothetical protein [Pseudomonadota bacterium]
MTAKRAKRDIARVRVPEAQAPVFHLPGPHGGWFISLLYGFGTDVEVSMDELRKLLAGSRGTVIVARRLAGAELRLFEQYRADSDAEVHARRFWRGRRR